MERELTLAQINQLDWKKTGGLIPAVIQDHESLSVLMVGMMSPESLERTLSEGLVTFYSRTKGRLWQKGETSGHTLKVIHVSMDCDQDCLLFLAKAHGPTCHLMTPSCFGDVPMLKTPFGFLAKLEALIEERRLQSLRPSDQDFTSAPKISYTESLLKSGTKRCAQKVGEEATETALAAVAGDDQEVLAEASDLVYHLMVTLASRGLSLSKVVLELEKRHKATQAFEQP